MEPRVQAELDALLSYAKGVARSVEMVGERRDAVVAARAYIGGALTTLGHVGLLDDQERHEWLTRLMSELPPPDAGRTTFSQKRL